MSTQPAQALTPEPAHAPAKPKRVPDVTNSYRKAHKNYVLVAGLLASWELIGIEPDKLGEKWGVVLKSPSGVPLILFTLLAYCAYKLIIEWCQCDRERRKHPAVRFDYWVAHVLAFGAVAIGLIQYLTRVQLAEIVNRHLSGWGVLFGSSTSILVIAVIVVIMALRQFSGKMPRAIIIAAVVMAMIAVPMGIMAWIALNRDYATMILWGVGGTVASVAAAAGQFLIGRSRVGPMTRGGLFGQFRKNQPSVGTES